MALLAPAILGEVRASPSPRSQGNLDRPPGNSGCDFRLVCANDHVVLVHWGQIGEGMSRLGSAPLNFVFVSNTKAVVDGLIEFP
jgi:hypothetical protein